MADQPEKTVHGPEPSDVRLRPILITGATLLATVAIVSLAAWLITYVMSGRPASEPAGTFVPPTPQAAPAPQLEAHPALDIDAFHREKAKLLSHYAWSDRKAGFIRMPIDQAMATLAAQHAREQHP